jgi:hypothetical protein
MAQQVIGEGQASNFVTVDHCSTECVGIHAARRATRFEALEPLRQGVRACFGGFAAGIAGGLKVRHDHGSQFVADDYQRELAFLGIQSSPAFVREPEGNGCVERFIRTLKENLLWVRRFDTIEDLCLALHRFKETYNQTWIVERHGYQTPAAIRAAHLARSRPRHEPATRCLTTVDRYMAAKAPAPRVSLRFIAAWSLLVDLDALYRHGLLFPAHGLRAFVAGKWVSLKKVGRRWGELDLPFRLSLSLVWVFERVLHCPEHRSCALAHFVFAHQNSG